MARVFSIKVTGLEGAQLDMVRLGKKRKDQIIRTLWTKLVEFTPVISGRGRSNWNINSFVENPSGSYAFPVYPGTPVGGKKVSIINPLSYLSWLDIGDANRAPRNFMQSAVNEATRELNS